MPTKALFRLQAGLGLGWSGPQKPHSPAHALTPTEHRGKFEFKFEGRANERERESREERKGGNKRDWGRWEKGVGKNAIREGTGGGRTGRKGTERERPFSWSCRPISLFLFSQPLLLLL